MSTVKKTAEVKAPALADKIDEVDALQYEKLMLQINTLDLQKQLLQAQLQGLANSFNAKYTLTEKDQIDLNTRDIKRAVPTE